MKKCSKCGMVLDLNLFYSDRKTSDGKTCWCASCMKTASKNYARNNPEKHLAKALAWAAKNPERRKMNRKNYYEKNKEKELTNMSSWYKSNIEHRKAYSKKRRIEKKDELAVLDRKIKLRNMYGLTLEQYDAMYHAQNGVCAICSEINVSGKRLSVDHNHKTGTVRELLCSRCNFAIGQLRDDTAIVKKALEYLEKHEIKEPV